MKPFCRERFTPVRLQALDPAIYNLEIIKNSAAQDAHFPQRGSLDIEGTARILNFRRQAA